MGDYANLSTILGGKGNRYATVSMSLKSWAPQVVATFAARYIIEGCVILKYLVSTSIFSNSLSYVQTFSCTSGGGSTLSGFTSSYVSSVKPRSSSIGMVSLIFMNINGAAINSEPAKRAHEDANSLIKGTPKASMRKVMAAPADWMPL